MKPQDLLVSVQLLLPPFVEGTWTYGELADALGLSDSEANVSVRRASEAGLLTMARGRTAKPQVIRRSLLEFLEHGVTYAFHVVPGAITRGVPTAMSAPPLDGLMAVEPTETWVWPHERGSVRGQAVEPLYSSVPEAALAQPELHELLALIDAIRLGRSRERTLAAKTLRPRVLGERTK